jgi:phosphoglycerate dehydrogenase-like enzyme
MLAVVPERFRDGLGNAPPEAELRWYRDPEQAQGAIADAEALWFDRRSAGPIEELLSRAQKLAWVHTQTVGIDQLPLDELEQMSIKVTNGAGLFAVPIAEYVVMAMLAAAKDLPALLRAQAGERWLDQAPADEELLDTVALIVGYGHIGRAIARRLRGMGVRTLGVRSRAQGAGVIGPADWRPRLAEFDWVVITAPLTPLTRHLISHEELSAMKRGAWLLNVARGQIVNTQALLVALQEKRIGGAYLDVTDPEPLPAGHPLWQQPNVIITPHTSFASRRFVDRAGELFGGNLSRYLEHKPLRNLIDFRAGY